MRRCWWSGLLVLLAVVVSGCQPKLNVVSPFAHHPVLVSTGPTGEAGNGASGSEVDLDRHGRYVAFTSTATDLTADEQHDWSTRIFRRDASTGEVLQVDVDVDGGDPASGSSRGVAMSADGERVAFWSDKPGLAPETPPPGIYLRDLRAGRTELVSEAPMQRDVALSADGRRVAFAGAVVDIESGRRWSIARSDGGPARPLAISADGATVATVDSEPSDSTPGRRSAVLRIIDLASEEETLIGLGAEVADGHLHDCLSVTIDGDGSTAAVACGLESPRTYLVDVESGTSSPVDVGQPAVLAPSLSDDGDLLAVAAGDDVVTDEQAFDTYLVDLGGGPARRVTSSDPRGFSHPVLAGDGDAVAITYLPLDDPGLAQVYLVRLSR